MTALTEMGRHGKTTAQEQLERERKRTTARPNNSRPFRFAHGIGDDAASMREAKRPLCV